jgi:hypothetical protein
VAGTTVRLLCGWLRYDKPFRYFVDGAGLDVLPLLEHYRADRESDGTTTRFYAHGADCDKALRGFYYDRRFEAWQFRSDIFWSYKGNKSRQCILAQDGLSTDFRYRIKHSFIQRGRDTSPLFTELGQKFEVFDDREGRLLGTIEIAAFSLPLIIPLPVVGCGLDSGAPAWKCFAGLMKGEPSISAGYTLRAANDPQQNPFIPSERPETWEVTSLAKALGLDQRQPTD